MRPILKRTLALCLASALCILPLSGCSKREGDGSVPASAPAQSRIESDISSGASSSFAPSDPSSSPASSQSGSSQTEGTGVSSPASSQPAASQPASSSSPSQDKPSDSSPSTATQGTEIPYDYRLLRDFSDYINLAIRPLARENFESGWMDDRPLINAGMELCRDLLGGQEEPRVEKARLLEEVERYFGRSVQSPDNGGSYCRYEDGYYYPTEVFELSDAYKFEAKKAYDLGDNYIRVEGKTTLFNVYQEPAALYDAVVVLHRVPDSYYGYYLVAQSYGG